MPPRGIDITPLEHKITLYVDNVVFLLQDSLKSMMELQRLLGLFSEASGCKVNDQTSIIIDFSNTE